MARQTIGLIQYKEVLHLGWDPYFCDITYDVHMPNVSLKRMLGSNSVKELWRFC